MGRAVIEISIRRELAAEHPGFVVGCAERDHGIEVFGINHEPPESEGAQTRDPNDLPEAGYVGDPGGRARAWPASNGPAGVNG